VTPAARVPAGDVHADALARLERWPAPDAQQEQLRLAFVAHLRGNPDGVTRRCRPDHVTASALVLSGDGQEVLLTLHAKVGRWLQFGGHVEPGDMTLASAALREAVEESGVARLRLASDEPLRLDRHGAPCAADARHHLDVQYLAVAEGRPEPTTSEESHDVRWFPVDALPADADDAVRALVAHAVSVRR
jgi:8-oxo-dGTP pyrophosphatase MutT (NUDIX family)